MSAPQITVLGKFLIRGKLYFNTLTLIVNIFPISSLFKLVIFDLSIKEYGRSHNKSFIFSIFFFRKYFLVLVPTPFMVFISESKKLETHGGYFLFAAAPSSIPGGSGGQTFDENHANQCYGESCNEVISENQHGETDF